jgi:hypothetical protein
MDMVRLLVIIAAMLCGLGALAELRPPTQTACDDLLATWSDRLDAEGFTSSVVPPFVIAGNLGRPELDAWRERTILPARRALTDAYFRTPPSRPILILLFADEASYRHYAKTWFGDTNVSYYGYFRHDGVMLMNIATGGGTLVHELVHALLKPDFPTCPDWLNEGMGSLYEQCTLEPLAGLPNWRLPALQEAIRAGTLRPLQELIEDEHFYRKDLVGMNYAQARYLLMYLQEKGLLRPFYRSLRVGHTSDSTGLAALQKVIGDQKLRDFEQQWRTWVLGLRFP